MSKEPLFKVVRELVDWRTLLMLALIFCAVYFFCFPPRAHAASGTEVDLRPVLDPLITLAATLLTGLGSWALARLSTWLKLRNDSLVRDLLTDGVHTAVDYAIAKLAVKEADYASVTVQNAIVAEATRFLVAHFPDALNYFGLTGDGVARMVLARLPAPPPQAAPGA